MSMGLYQSPSHKQKTSDFLFKYFAGNEDLRSFLESHTPIGVSPKNVSPKRVLMDIYD